MQIVAPVSSRLRRFQEQFARALIDPTPSADFAPDVARLVAQPGFAVYRNTVHKGCIDALQANYPAVTRLVGEEWMRAAASEFVRAQLPQSPLLLDYGAEFAAFLAEFEPAAELPYLSGVARLDRFWTEAHRARDEPPIAAERIAALTHEDYLHAALRPHASARWIWFEAQPVYTIWSRNRDPGAFDDGEIDWDGEGALIVRPHDDVRFCLLSRPEVVFLDACAAGRTLAEAALAALDADGSADLARTMDRLLTAGAFARIQLDPRDR
jgi:hypothetical protein